MKQTFVLFSFLYLVHSGDSVITNIIGSQQECRENVYESSPVIPGCIEDAKFTPNHEKKTKNCDNKDKMCFTYVSPEQKTACLEMTFFGKGKLDVRDIPFKIAHTGKNCGPTFKNCKNNYHHVYFNITVRGGSTFRMENFENCNGDSKETIECQPQCVDISQPENSLINYVREGAFYPTGDTTPYDSGVNQTYQFSLCSSRTNHCGHFWLATPQYEKGTEKVILLMDKDEYEENGELVIYIPKDDKWNQGVIRVHRSQDSIDGCQDDTNVVHTQDVTKEDDGSFYHRVRINHAPRHGFTKVSWTPAGSDQTSCSVLIVRKSFGHIVIVLIILSFILVGLVGFSLHFINKRKEKEIKTAQELQSKPKTILVLADKKAGVLFKQNVQNFVNYLSDFHVLNYNVIYSGDISCNGVKPTEDPQAWWKRIISDETVEENFFIMLVVSPASQPQKYKPINLVETQLMEMQPTNYKNGMLFRAYENQKLAVIQFPDSAFHPKDGVPEILPAEYWTSLFYLPDYVEELLELMKGDFKDFVLPDELIPSNNEKWKTFIDGYKDGKVVEEKKEKPGKGNVIITMEENIDSLNNEKAGKDELSKDLPGLRDMKSRDKITIDE